MDSNIATVNPDTLLNDVDRIITRARLHHLLVVKDGKAVVMITQRLTRQVGRRALKPIETDPRDALRGGGYGVFQGAMETGSDPVQAKIHAVEAPKELASESGLEKELVMSETVTGPFEAAAEIGPESRAQLEDALLSEMIDNQDDGTERKTEDN
jgi:CBS domain-containing protein